MDVVGYAGQIVEVIQALHGVYIRVKGLGKEIDDAMADCINMETDVLSLKKLFDRKTSSKFPEQVTIITSEFKSLHHSIKKLRKLFKTYDRISQKWYGKMVWAYDKPRESIFEILSSFSSYRAMFTKALHIINEGHNKDQERALKEMREQAKKASEERKKENTELKKKLKAMDESNKKAAEKLDQVLKGLMAKNEASPENRSKAVEGWLVNEKGMGEEEAKSYACATLREGRVPTSKTEEVSKPNKVLKENGAARKNSNTKDSTRKIDTKMLNTKSKSSSPDKREIETEKKQHRPSNTGSPSPAREEKEAEAAIKQTRPSKTSSPKPDRTEKETNSSPSPSLKQAQLATSKEESWKPKRTFDKSSSPNSKRLQSPPTKDKAPISSLPESGTKDVNPSRKLKVPVILVQEPSFATHHINAAGLKRSSSTSPSTSSHIATSGNVKQASSVTSNNSHRSTDTQKSTSGSASKGYIDKNKTSAHNNNIYFTISTKGTAHAGPFIAATMSKDTLTSPIGTSESASDLFKATIEAGMRHVKEGEKRGRSTDDLQRVRLLTAQDIYPGNGKGRRRSRSEVEGTNVHSHSDGRVHTSRSSDDLYRQAHG